LTPPASTPFHDEWIERGQFNSKRCIQSSVLCVVPLQSEELVPPEVARDNGKLGFKDSSYKILVPSLIFYEQKL